MLNCIVSLILSCILTFSSYTSIPEVEITPVPEEEHVLLEAQEGVYRIGISQLVSHVALDAATKGFKDVLTEKLGDKVMFDERNAMGDSSKCTQTANDFVKGNYDLIFANASPALQAAAEQTTIPVLGTAVTDYGTLLGIENFNGTVGGNISGTCDLPSPTAQAEMIMELFPHCKKVGILYGADETQLFWQSKAISAYLSAKGIECSFYPFKEDTVEAITAEACNQSDVIYTPSDNAVSFSAGIIGEICLTAKVPVVSGNKYLCESFAVATLSIDYYKLGRRTGEMAYRILVEGADVATMPIEYDEEATKMYNPEIASDLGITIPEDYIPVE